ncbi:MAG: 2-amino-4-hydroxy-6-hydroxymethyldihydropteridine diphosphokinase [Flavobacteriales bacterium]
MAVFILSLGSNQGDRLQHLQNSISELKLIGKIQGISSVYQSESWGFDDDKFYNIVLLWTPNQELRPHEALRAFQNIETKLGRQEKSSEKYESRPIDIDIISIDEQRIDRLDLQIPHPLFSQRNFVLLPLAELKPDFIHPKTKETIEELLLACEGEGKIEKLGGLIE